MDNHQHSNSLPGFLPAQIGNAPITMSSREIAELTGKRHDHVKRDIEKMLTELGEDAPKFGDIYLDSMNREQTEYRLDRDLTENLLLGYSAPLRRKVLARMRELEGIVAGNSLAIPNFSDPVAAARAWADEVEARRHAELTKAEIGSRREATAMNTAMLANKRAKELQKQLDGLADWATVKRMEKFYSRDFPWRPLKKMSEKLGAPINHVTDVNYGEVNSYHADVWMAVYGVTIPAAKAGA